MHGNNQQGLSSKFVLPRAQLIYAGILWLLYPSYLNFTSKQQKMNTELIASINTENRIVLTNIDPKIQITMIKAISLLFSPLLSSQKQLIMAVTPVMMTTPQKIRRFDIISVTDIRGRKRERIPIVVLAELIQSSPVTAITITELWFNIRRRFYNRRKQQEIMHRHTATAIFFSERRFVSSIIRAKVTMAITKDANTMEPKADVNSHLQAVGRQCLPSTRQYQNEQATATVNTMTQQKMKAKKNQMKNQITVTMVSTVLSYLLSFLSMLTSNMQLSEQIQKNVKRILKAILMIGVMNIPHFSDKNWEATLIRVIPSYIFFLKHTRTIVYTTKIRRKGIPIAASPTANPKMARPSSRASVNTSKKYTIIFGISLIKKMQAKLSTIDMPIHAIIYPEQEMTCISYLRSMLPFSPIQYIPAARNAPSRIKNPTTHPTSLNFLSATGSERHSEHLLLQSS